MNRFLATLCQRIHHLLYRFEVVLLDRGLRDHWIYFNVADLTTWWFHKSNEYHDRL